MFKLFRDSMFNPKNIIYYRAKKPLFVIFYILFVSLFMALAMIVEPLSYKELDFTDKKEFISKFKENNCYIEDGVFHASNSFNITIGNYSFGFVGDNGSISDLSELSTIAIIDDGIYEVLSTGTNTTSGLKIKVSTLKELSDKFTNVDLKTIDVDSEFFLGVDEVIKKGKPIVVSSLFFAGLLNGAIYILGFALLTYIFLGFFFKIKKYMKSSQLFKMLIFASTSVVIGEALMTLVRLPIFVNWIILLITFIPLYILEKEFATRIRMKEIGSGLMNDSRIIDKVNELLKKNDDSSNDDDNNNNNNE